MSSDNIENIVDVVDEAISTSASEEAGSEKGSPDGVVVVGERPRGRFGDSEYDLAHQKRQQRRLIRDYEIDVDPRRFNNQRAEQALALDDRIVGLIEGAETEDVVPGGIASMARVNTDILEYIDLDTPDGLVRGTKGLTIRLKRAPAPVSSLSLQIRFKSLDPELTKRSFLAKDAKGRTVRHRQAFRATHTMYTVIVSIPTKFGKRFAKWKVIETLCPGICEFIGIKKLGTPVIRRPPKYVWKSCNFRGILIHGQRIIASLSLTYASHQDAVSGSEAFQGKLQMRLKHSTIQEDTNTLMDRFRKMYFFYYDHVVNCDYAFFGTSLKRPKIPRITREYQIAFDPEQWQERDGLDGAVHAFHKWVEDLGEKVNGFDVVDVKNLPPPRIMEHFTLDSQTYHLKSRHFRDQLVVKMERNPETRKASITVKYKNWDNDLVESFPVRVAQGYSYTSKLEQDYHPTYARMALSLAVDIPFDQQFTAWGEIGAMFPGFLEFAQMDESWPVVTRFYKAKWEQNRQLLRLNEANAIGKISLEYPTIKDALAGTGLFHGQWSYRLREPTSESERGEVWVNRLAKAYQIYFSHVVSSPWNYVLQNVNKPNKLLSTMLADPNIPCLRTVGLLVLSRRQRAPLYDVLVLERKGKKYAADFPKGKLPDEEANELDGALRQTEEETGLKTTDLHVASHLRFVADRFVMKDEKVIQKKQFVLFLAVTKTNTAIQLSSQHVGFKWLPWNGVSSLDVGRVLLNQCIAQLAPNISEFVQSLAEK